MNLQPATVTGDWTQSNYPCFLDPSVNWNGWACPYFTREVAEQVLKDLDVSWELSENGSYFTIRGFEATDEENYHAEPTPHGTLYTIGAWAWCWQIVEEVKS